MRTAEDVLDNVSDEKRGTKFKAACRRADYSGIDGAKNLAIKAMKEYASERSASLVEENKKLREALRTQNETLLAIISGKRVVNLDEAIAYYQSLLSTDKTEQV